MKSVGIALQRTYLKKKLQQELQLTPGNSSTR